MEATLLFPLLSAFLKYKVIQTLGDEFLSIAAQEYTDLAEDNTSILLSSIFKDQKIESDLRKATEKAEECFRKSVLKPDLLQWIISLPIASSPILQKALLELPNAADEEQLLGALRSTIKRDWKNLSDEDIEEAISIYLRCVRRAIGPIKSHALTVIRQSVLRTEEATERTETKIDELLRRTPLKQKDPNKTLLRTYLHLVSSSEIGKLRSGPYIPRKVKVFEELPYARYAVRETISEENQTVKKDPPELLDLIVVQAEKVILQGEPGIGKTTSMQYLSKSFAEKLLRDGGLLPIFTELKTYSGESLESFLSDRVNRILKIGNASLGSTPDDRQVEIEKWIDQFGNRMILLFDGLNEVLPIYHIKIRDELRAWSQLSPRIVVTCRKWDYDKSLGENFSTYEMQGLQTEDIQIFLANILGEKGKEIFDTQLDREDMLSLASNPLMLWLIVAIAQQDPNTSLPLNRGQLFDRFVNYMPIIRLDEGIPLQVPPDIVETALAKISFEMQQRGQLTTSLDKIRKLNIPTSHISLERILSQAKDCRFLKADGTKGEPLEFLHQLFQEFFAAKQIDALVTSKQGLKNILFSIPVNTKRWDEVLEMLVGIYNQPSDVILWLAQEAISSENAHLCLLSYECWQSSNVYEDINILEPVVSALIQVFKWGISSYQRRRAVTCLIELGERAVPYLISALKDPYYDIRWFTINVFRFVHDTRAIRPLIRLINDEVHFVASNAIEVLRKFGDISVVDELISALINREIEIREIDLIKIISDQIIDKAQIISDPQKMAALVNKWEKYYSIREILLHSYQVLDQDQLENIITELQKCEQSELLYSGFCLCGEIHNILGHSDQSLNEFSRAIQLNPTSSWAYEGRANIYINMEKYDNALSDLDIAIKYDAYSSTAFVQRAKVYRKLRDQNLAINELNRALEIDPKPYDILIYRGRTYFFFGQYQSAISDFTRALELEPNNNEALNERGYTHFVLDNHELALDDLNHSLEVKPKSFTPRLFRSMVFRELHQYEAALADSNQAINLDSESSIAYFTRGMVNISLKKYESALVDFNRAIELDPSYSLAITKRGRIHEFLEQYDAALIDYNRAIELDSDDSSVIESRGLIYQILGQYDNSLVDFNRAIELNPNKSSIFRRRGETYHLMERYESAIADYTQALKLDPTDTWAVRSRGLSYQKLGQYENALVDFTIALEADPNSSSTYAKRGRTYRLIHKYEAALADYNRAIELDPTESSLFAGRGETYSLMEQYESAIVEFNRSIELDPNYSWAIGRRGVVYRILGQFDEALSDFTRYIEADKKSSWRYYQRALTLFLQRKLEEAIRDLDVAINISKDLYSDNPNNFRNLFNLAIYLLAKGEYATSESIYIEGMSKHVPLDILYDAINDLNEYLVVFPDQPNASSIRSRLQEKINRNITSVLV